ncbi:isochorismate synthase [Actinophytocola sp.]|uniref:isochorismate synthase n=1 Tax=Actinophytocola sp. TaxID=1872138 RepID=UPI003D6B65A5
MTPELIADYRPGSFLLTSPRRGLLATGARTVVAEPDPDELSARVTKLLVDSDVPLAVGALPFDSTGERATAPHVVLPRSVRWSGPVRPARTGRPVPVDLDVVPVPAPAEYERAVARAVTRLRAGELDKVVLARALRLHSAGPVAVAPLLANLAADNATGYTYAVDLPTGGASRRTLVGATPEMLLSRSGLTVVCNPLAGSMPRHPDPELDRASAEALAASAKDIEEHRVVIETVVDALRPFCRTLTVPDGPSLVSTSAVWHLSTMITGELADPGISSLRLACALHPTPAVCGRPFGTAKDTIAELEPFDRGFYAGAIGWCDADGDGQWVVAIRCAEITEPAPGAGPAASGSTLTLYSGAGIMPASQPQLELAETSAKFRTLLRAMGVPDIPA